MLLRRLRWDILDPRERLYLGYWLMTAPGVKIWTTTHNFDDPDTPVMDQGLTDKPVVIGDDVYIASNAFIMPGTTLPRGCIVAAGAVISGKAYRPFSILAGNPAQVIGYRGGRSPDVELITPTGSSAAVSPSVRGHALSAHR